MMRIVTLSQLPVVDLSRSAVLQSRLKMSYVGKPMEVTFSHLSSLLCFLQTALKSEYFKRETTIILLL